MYSGHVFWTMKLICIQEEMDYLKIGKLILKGTSIAITNGS